MLVSDDLAAIHHCVHCQTLLSCIKFEDKSFNDVFAVRLELSSELSDNLAFWLFYMAIKNKVALHVFQLPGFLKCP